MSIKLSVIVPFLNSHEIVRRQVLHFHNIGLNDYKNVEVIFMDDGSNPPLTYSGNLERFYLYATNDTRQWTSGIARNSGAKLSRGEWLFMMDGDYILTREALDIAIAFNGDRLGTRREFGVLDENGKLTQDIEVLKAWGLPEDRIRVRNKSITPQTNQFIMRKSVFFDIGMYDEKNILTHPYPQKEDNYLLKAWYNYVRTGKAKLPGDEIRPLLYMFPNGRFCGDPDANPFGMFHTLSRK